MIKVKRRGKERVSAGSERVSTHRVTEAKPKSIYKTSSSVLSVASNARLDYRRSNHRECKDPKTQVEILHASLIVHGNKLDGSSKACIARRDFSLGKTGRSSRLSMYCPANCRALSSNNGSSSRSATRVTDVCSFAITSPKIVCCNFCKGLFLKAAWALG